jgi:hypothetical protein
MTKPNGYVIYEGPSQYDGKPIMVVALGFAKASTNSKTGGMIQTYIMRSDIHPKEASITGEDASICGDCIHRGRADGTKAHGRSCFVNLGHGPRAVYDAYHRGNYPRMSPEVVGRLVADVGGKVRIGYYGDGAMAPMSVWTGLVGESRNTAYSHQWRDRPQFATFAMASVESEAERREAKALGWRTYRCREAGAPVLQGETECPASEERGKLLTCEQCLLCDGTRRNRKSDVTIIVHGTLKGNFKKVIPLQVAH